MEAKDTVLKELPQMDMPFATWLSGSGQVDVFKAIIQRDREAQAEISFKAGTKEVVEWLTDYVPMFTADDKEWQAQKKRWGL